MHGLGHALEGLSVSAVPVPEREDAGAGDCDDRQGERGACPLHALFTELASMAVGAWPSLVAPSVVPQLAVFTDARAFTAPRVAFRSRAPPRIPA
jgi:hypothetical protein